MPKTNVYSPHEDGRRVEVGWWPNGTVQVGTTLRNPLNAGDLPEGVSITETATPPGGVSDSGGWAWEGQFTDLDRHGVNKLIRALREARDKAYGRDE